MIPKLKQNNQKQNHVSYILDFSDTSNNSSCQRKFCTDTVNKNISGFSVYLDTYMNLGFVFFGKIKQSLDKNNPFKNYSALHTQF